MEGLCFEVKSREGEERSSDGCRAGSHCSSSSVLPGKLTSTRRSTDAITQEHEEGEVEVRYKLRLMGSLPVHSLTSMAMLPWVVAEISKAQASKKRPGGFEDSSQTVSLCVSVSWVRCVSVLGEGTAWDPLTHTLLFQCSPHQLTKLIHISQEPSSFGCLLRDAACSACYVFQCQDSTKVSVCMRVCPKLF